MIGFSAYFTGIVLDGVAMGDDSKLASLVEDGFSSDRWLPFSTTAEKLQLFGLIEDTLFGFSVPLINYAELADDTQMMIGQGSVSFTLGSALSDPDGIPNSSDEFFSDEITHCNFHSHDDVPVDTCVACTLASVESDGTKTLLAQGMMDLPDGYVASTSLEIPITEFAFDGANSINNVDGIIVQLCDNSAICTTEQWQLEENIELWPTSVNPNETFENIFERDLQNNGWEGTQINPTLQDVITNSGSGVNQLAANAVAALLNSEKYGTLYPYTTNDVILMTQDAIDSGNYNETNSQFIVENQAVCTT
jgi:hypothetical protein